MYERERSSLDCLEKEIASMKRITLVLGLVAVMAAMMAALAAPVMAKDNDGHKGDGYNRLDNQFDRLDNQVDFLVSDVGFSPVFTTNDDPNIGFVSDINQVSNAGFVSDIDD